MGATPKLSKMEARIKMVFPPAANVRLSSRLLPARGVVDTVLHPRSQHPTPMPRPNDSPDVAASKGLAYILRHGAEKEGLHIRSDGLVRLVDVVRIV